MRFEIKKSSWYETRAGASFLMLTPPKGYSAATSKYVVFFLFIELN